MRNFKLLMDFPRIQVLRSPIRICSLPFRLVFYRLEPLMYFIVSSVAMPKQRPQPRSHNPQQSTPRILPMPTTKTTTDKAKEYKMEELSCGWHYRSRPHSLVLSFSPVLSLELHSQNFISKTRFTAQACHLYLSRVSSGPFSSFSPHFSSSFLSDGNGVPPSSQHSRSSPGCSSQISSMLLGPSYGWRKLGRVCEMR